MPERLLYTPGSSFVNMDRVDVVEGMVREASHPDSLH